MDNNNIPNGIREIAKIAKNVISTALKPFLIILLIISILIIIIAGGVYSILFNDSEYKEGDWSSTPYASSQYTGNVSINSDGSINTTMTAQELWDKMLENDSRVDEYLDTPEELVKLMNAELITKYPDTRPNPDEEIDWDTFNENIDSNKVQGIIKFGRAQTDGTKIRMTFADSETFYGWIDSYNATGDQSAWNDAMTHFTIEENKTISNTSTAEPITEDETEKENNNSNTDENTQIEPKSYSVVVATWNESETTVTSNDPSISNSSSATHTMTTQQINYQEYISGFTMPFDYLWIFLVLGQQKDLVLELADLVYNSEIEITIYDNLTTTTETTTHNYTVTQTITEGNVIREDEISYYKTEKIITNANTLNISLSIADVWFAKYTQEYTYERTEESTGEPITIGERNHKNDIYCTLKVYFVSSKN